VQHCKSDKTLMRFLTPRGQKKHLQRVRHHKAKFEFAAQGSMAATAGVPA
jgi:hypothetical protein